MDRPYIACHMVTSVDGKVTGNFLGSPACEAATEMYYEINREYMKKGYSGFICGRITMEESFTGAWYLDLSEYEPIRCEYASENFLLNREELTDFYAIAFDPKGKLGWKSAFIEDSDPGYDKAQIVEILSEQADVRYLAYLRKMRIPYLFAGEKEIDVAMALKLLKEHFGISMLVLEGGSIINGHFLRAGLVDEISLVTAPVTADSDAKPLFEKGTVHRFNLLGAEQKNGVLVTKYKLREKNKAN